jgi:hypothetical protein
MTADNKSSLVQIAQAVLDETNQAINVNVISGGGGGGGTVEITNDVGNPIPVSGTVTVSSAVTYRNRVRIVYSSTNVTTGAWVQLLASIGATAIKEIEIFDSSGETLELGVGAAGSEVSNSYIVPGGNGRIPMQIAALSRLSVKAVSATANSGELVINLYG